MNASHIFVYLYLDFNSCFEAAPYISKGKNRLLKFCYVPATSAAHNRLFFAAAIYRTNEAKRQAVRAIRQSIFLDVYGQHRSSRGEISKQRQLNETEQHGAV